jgi:MFS family permease
VGFVTFYYPIISMVNEWWVVRRGLAWGIIASASGASGIVFPFIVEALLNKYGYKTTLRVIAVAMTVLTGPLLPFFKSRLPPAEQSVLARTDWTFLRSHYFGCTALLMLHRV